MEVEYDEIKATPTKKRRRFLFSEVNGKLVCYAKTPKGWTTNTSVRIPRKLKKRIKKEYAPRGRRPYDDGFLKQAIAYDRRRVDR